ncbi:hypothetical protein FH972_022210 [Carpinus fangiana]|uniref:Uncharacterized protein n=1 Tax=Carpinus fangiana TaxID=176857 RepID=A0A5N6KRY0_9ROSI|nr:hypothetical protein FH972_022210 [Carpinus fangiana]
MHNPHCHLSAQLGGGLHIRLRCGGAAGGGGGAPGICSAGALHRRQPAAALRPGVTGFRVQGSIDRHFPVLESRGGGVGRTWPVMMRRLCTLSYSRPVKST